MDYLLHKFKKVEINEYPKSGDVEILVYSDNSGHSEYSIQNTYYTYRNILEKSPVFKEWFNKVDFYGDYIEIGDDSNLMLFNKSDDYSYSLTINLHGSNHIFGTTIMNTPLIKHIIDFLEGNINEVYCTKELIDCLKFLKLIN